jgi:hypothetical protein
LVNFVLILLQVKKRLKRIENCRGTEIRRSLEVQELLKSDNVRNPSYQRPTRRETTNSESSAVIVATPGTSKIRKSFRKPPPPQQLRRSRTVSPPEATTSSTYLKVNQPEPTTTSPTSSPDLGNWLKRGGSCRWSLLGGRTGSLRRKKKQSAATVPASKNNRDEIHKNTLCD